MAKSDFRRPTLANIIDRVKSSINTRLGFNGQSLPYSPINDLADAVAAESHMIHAVLDRAIDDTFIQFATGNALDDKGIFLNTPRRLAIPAVIITSIENTTAFDIVIDSGKGFASGLVTAYLPVQTTILANSSLEVLLYCNTNDIPDLQANGLQFDDSTFPALASSGLVIDSASSYYTPSTPVETDNEYRLRLLSTISSPKTGSARNYYDWTIASSGNIEKAFIFENQENINHVRVVITTKNNALDLDTLQSARSYIDQRRTVGTRVDVELAEYEPYDININNLSPDTPEIRAAIKKELEAMFFDRAHPDNSTYPKPPSTNGTIKRAWVWDAVANTAGVNHFELTRGDSITIMDTDLVPLPGRLVALANLKFNGVIYS